MDNSFHLQLLRVTQQFQPFQQHSTYFDDLHLDAVQNVIDAAAVIRLTPSEKESRQREVSFPSFLTGPIQYAISVNRPYFLHFCADFMPFLPKLSRSLFKFF
jgi:hypothetical protein